VEDVDAGLDRDAAVAAQSLHEFFDAPSGLAFEPSADREGANTMVRWASMESRLSW
jgi:hypothetical protein